MANRIILGELDIAPLLKAQKVFSEALAEAETPLEKTGTIKRFELCYELAWKTMRRILLKQGLEANNPRDVFRLAAANHLINDPHEWFEAIRRRNESTHAYNEEIVVDLFDSLSHDKGYLDAFIVTIGQLK
ncbi:MAG: nucleotidyltransferase substrate binding protein [Candidatus Dependentiae bacterium]|jgi:nucleotidyltransferase substrate binding protein (TIGR01987 family)|nr:nucleotidyltransferase substrate binding protein [Candidatus Dependentiae bacterium]